MSQSTLSRVVLATVLSVFLTVPLWAACGTTTFTPNRLAGNGYVYAVAPSTHNALYVTDSANQQIAIFDMEWGGVLASLRYDPNGNVFSNGQVNPQAQELVWGHDPGGMLQPAFWTGNSSYNPTQAGDSGQSGDWGRGSPVYGAACKGGSMLLIMTSTLDAFENQASWGNGMNFPRAAGIDHGVPHANMWLSPYSVTVTASFVSNPQGTPANYLKLDHFWHSTDVLEDFGGAWFTFGVYAPGTTDPSDGQNYHPEYGANSFRFAQYYPNCQNGCAGGTVSKFMIGLYPTSDYKSGIAISMNATNWLNNLSVKQNGPFFDTFWNNVSIGMSADGWYYAPGQGRRFVAYIMAGDWDKATLFSPQ
jgi:hypothetical protein